MLGCSNSYVRSDPCQCNSDCTKYGDCCSDYTSVCTAASCARFGCGSSYDSSRACQCNSKCARYSNCCSDYDGLCNGSPSPSPTPSPSPAPSPSPSQPIPSPSPGPLPSPSPSPDASAYWAGVDRSSKAALQQRLRSGFNGLGYGGLWDAYKSVWVNLPGGCSGRVYDIYSTKCWTPGSGQCGTYRKEGDCYNREHSWPKSWWNRNKNNAYSDMFHVMPSDGYVNGRRGSWPFGEVSSPSYVSSEGNKVGPCTTPGYSGTCFEPTDRAKGLVARGHFYMTVRYAGEFACCDKDAVNGAEIKPWAVNLLLKWDAAHPPAAWEQEFNTRTQSWQGNRNPFIDFPGLSQTLFR